MSTEDPPGDGPTDGDLDSLLGQLGQLISAADPLPPSTSQDREASIDELAIERLRQGQLDDEQRNQLLARLANDASARELWVEAAEERGQLDPQFRDRIVATIVAQRASEGLTAPPSQATGRSGLRIAGWVALAACVALVLLWGGTAYRQHNMPPAPAYGLTLSGQLVDTRGTGPADQDVAEIPAFARAGTLELTLRPDGAQDAPPMTLHMCALAPDGELHRFTPQDGLIVELRNGVFVARAMADDLFAGQSGRWTLLLILEPEGSRWTPARRSRWARNSAPAALAAAGHSWAGPGGRRLVVQEIDLQP